MTLILPQCHPSVKHPVALPSFTTACHSVSMSQAELLRSALEQAGLSNREAGTRLAQVSKGALTAENARASIVRWRRGSGISDENAERLAEMLGLPPGYFKKPRPEPDELARIRRLAADLLREIDLLSNGGVAES